VKPHDPSDHVLTCFLLIHRGTTKTSPAKEMEESLSFLFLFRRKCLPLKRGCFFFVYVQPLLSLHTPFCNCSFSPICLKRQQTKELKCKRGKRKWRDFRLLKRPIQNSYLCVKTNKKPFLFSTFIWKHIYKDHGISLAFYYLAASKSPLRKVERLLFLI